jgi:hypothetical protein
MPKTQPEPQAPVYDSRTTLAMWECLDCGVRTSGWIAPHDHHPRRCRAIPKSGDYSQGRICGALLKQIYREEAACK